MTARSALEQTLADVEAAHQQARAARRERTRRRGRASGRRWSSSLAQESSHGARPSSRIWRTRRPRGRTRTSGRHRIWRQPRRTSPACRRGTTTRGGAGSGRSRCLRTTVERCGCCARRAPGRRGRRRRQPPRSVSTHREAELGATLAEAAAAQGALEQSDGRRRGGAPAGSRARRGASSPPPPSATRRSRRICNRRLPHGTHSSAILPRRAWSLRVSGAASSTVVSSFRRRARAHKARLEAQLNEERAEQERELAAHNDSMRQLELNREALQQSLDTTRGRAAAAARHAQRGAAELRARAIDERVRASAPGGRIRSGSGDARAGARRLPDASSSSPVSRSPSAPGSNSVLAERDAQLSAQAASHLAAAEQRG